VLFRSQKLKWKRERSSSKNKKRN